MDDAVRSVLEQLAVLPTQQKQYEHLRETFEENLEAHFSDPASPLLKLIEIARKGEIKWFDVPADLVPSDAASGSGSRSRGISYRSPFQYSPTKGKGYERPNWEEVERRAAFLGAVSKKIQCLENFLAADKEYVDEHLLESLKELEDPHEVPFRIRLRLGIAYFQACERDDIPPLLKVSTIVRDPRDALLPSSTSKEVRAASIALAEKVRDRVYREIAQEALQELRRKHEKKQSINAWWHELDHLRKKASDIFCGEELLELSEEDYRKHGKRSTSTGLGNTEAQQPPTEKDKQIEKIELEAATVFEDKSRTSGVKTHVHSDVREWAVQSFHTYNKEYSSEEAKDKVVDIAERHNYHFTRRWLEGEVNKQSGS